ncbi:hypothetical protein [Deefgea sp. CFH1-16]|nr:hypothetical protein [Deefgea sp. CFH1-16]
MIERRPAKRPTLALKHTLASLLLASFFYRLRHCTSQTASAT